MTVVFFGIACSLAALGLLWVWSVRGSAEDGPPLVLDWDPGLGSRAAAATLLQQGLVTNAVLFAGLLELHGGPSGIEEGPHLVRQGLSPLALVRLLKRDQRRPVSRVLLPEGWTGREMGVRLHAHGICPEAAFAAMLRDPGLLGRLGVGAPSLEGYLFPATYELHANTPAAAVVEKLAGEMHARLSRLRREHARQFARLAEERDWGVHEILTLASIVEKEATLAEERPVIASVYLNRLSDPEFEPRGRLQADPTAAYGCQVVRPVPASCSGYAGKLTPELLRDATNPYNTYKHAGLPPGPIGNPGEASLRAVLAPADTSYLFFVAKGDGGHTFSRTFAEHRAAIRHTHPRL